MDFTVCAPSAQARPNATPAQHLSNTPWHRRNIRNIRSFHSRVNSILCLADCSRTMLLFDSIDPIYSMHWLRHFTRMPEAGMRNGPTNLMRDGSVC